jgi:hypothetical protein
VPPPLTAPTSGATTSCWPGRKVGRIKTSQQSKPVPRQTNSIARWWLPPRGLDELHQQSRITATTWAALGARLDDRQRMDLIFTVGRYGVLATALNPLTELPPQPNELEAIDDDRT